jgi:thioredoxin reductase (NADPH)
MTTAYDLIVVGEGFAGLTCASEASRLGLNVATFEAGFFGGLVVNVNELEHFDDADGLSGMDYAGLLASRNKKAGVKSLNDAVTAVRRAGDIFEVEVGAIKHTARCVVMASGARLAKLSVPGEVEFEGRGVSHCADCDAPMFTGAEVLVVGGGNWALQDALILAQECATVHVAYAEPELSACEEYVSRVTSDAKIRLHPGLTVTEIVGDDSGMTGVRMRDSAGTAQELPVTGLFAIVGLQPNADAAPDEVGRDDHGSLVVNDDLETAVPGLWAIGQVRSGFKGWLVDAVADGRRAAGSVAARIA